MSPKQTDPAIRTALIEHAARMVAEEGSQALTLRRLTRAVGVSTMAIYTHFGGMDELRSAIRQEGFARLADHMDRVETTADPVADLVALGRAYYVNATSNPNLYRAMFMEAGADPGREAGAGMGTFDRLVAAVARGQDAGRLGPGRPEDLAVQAWVTVHGIVALLLAGHLGEPEAQRCLAAMSAGTLVSMAGDPASLQASVDAGAARVPLPALRAGDPGAVAS